MNKYVIKHDDIGEKEVTSSELQDVMMKVDLAIREKFGVSQEGEEPEEQFSLESAKEVIEKAIERNYPEIYQYMDVEVDHKHETSTDEHENGIGNLDVDLNKKEGVTIEQKGDE